MLAWGLILLGFCIACALVYVALVMYEAKRSVGDAPQQPMFVCDKHGPIQASALFRFEAGLSQPLEYCPLCFHDRVTEAEQKYGNR